MNQRSLSAAAVANEFLDLQASDSATPPLDHMKLQKLIFYAHAWWLAIKSVPLFDDDIEAWPWGPVVRNVYLEFADFGKRPIVGKKATKLERVNNSTIPFRLVVPAVEDGSIKAYLRDLYTKLHQHRNAGSLSRGNQGCPS